MYSTYWVTVGMLLTSVLCFMLLSLSGVLEEKRRLITQKSKMTMDEDPDVLVKGEEEILLNNSNSPDQVRFVIMAVKLNIFFACMHWCICVYYVPLFYSAGYLECLICSKVDL